VAHVLESILVEDRLQNVWRGLIDHEAFSLRTSKSESVWFNKPNPVGHVILSLLIIGYLYKHLPVFLVPQINIYSIKYVTNNWYSDGMHLLAYKQRNSYNIMRESSIILALVFVGLAIAQANWNVCGQGTSSI
jgi:hypothetical protein